MHLLKGYYARATLSSLVQAGMLILASARREIKAHVPEPFWRIVLKHREDGPNQPTTEFTWARGRLFDHAMATLLYELCLDAGNALVTKVL